MFESQIPRFSIHLLLGGLLCPKSTSLALTNKNSNSLLFEEVGKARFNEPVVVEPVEDALVGLSRVSENAQPNFFAWSQ